VIAWTFLVSLLRALRGPNDWAEAHWLIGYATGPIKRGLAGAVLDPLLRLAGPERAEAVVAAVAYALLAAMSVALVRVCFAVAAAGREGLLPALAFAVSPFVVLSGHQNGYLDHVFLTLAVAAVALAWRGRTLASAALVTAGVLVHETMLVVGLVPALWAAWRGSRGRAPEDAAHEEPSMLARRLVAYVLPLAAFAGLALAAARSDPAATERALAAQLGRYEFVEQRRNENVARALAMSFGEALRQESPEFVQRLTRPRYLTSVLPLVALLLLFAARRLPRAGAASAAAMALLPLGLLAIAWDTGRVWSYASFVALLAAGMAARHGRPAPGAVPPWFLWGSAAMLIFGIVNQTPLMDDQRERFPLAVRALLYAPALAAAAAALVPPRRRTGGDSGTAR
jgi:hypothetical protein